MTSPDEDTKLPDPDGPEIDDEDPSSAHQTRASSPSSSNASAAQPTETAKSSGADTEPDYNLVWLTPPSSRAGGTQAQDSSRSTAPLAFPIKMPSPSPIEAPGANTPSPSIHPLQITQLQSPLLGLPGELRNKVYEYVHIDQPELEIGISADERMLVAPPGYDWTCRQTAVQKTGCGR